MEQAFIRWTILFSERNSNLFNANASAMLSKTMTLQFVSGEWSVVSEYCIFRQITHHSPLTTPINLTLDKMLSF